MREIRATSYFWRIAVDTNGRLKRVTEDGD